MVRIDNKTTSLIFILMGVLSIVSMITEFPSSALAAKAFSVSDIDINILLSVGILCIITGLLLGLRKDPEDGRPAAHVRERALPRHRDRAKRRSGRRVQAFGVNSCSPKVQG